MTSLWTGRERGKWLVGLLGDLRDMVRDVPLPSASPLPPRPRTELGGCDQDGGQELERASWTETRPSSRRGGLSAGLPVWLPLHTAKPRPGVSRPRPWEEPLLSYCLLALYPRAAEARPVRTLAKGTERTEKGEGVTKQSLYLFNKKIISLKK